MTSEFDYQADQIFVVGHRNTGSGILSLLISLDNHLASLDFKQKTLQQKILDWNKFVENGPDDAHLYGFINFGASDHIKALGLADRCDRYVHKCHFFELDGASPSKRNPLLDQLTGRKQSIGIYVTQSCIEKLQTIRPDTPKIDFYRSWVYANQKSLLSSFYGIDCGHTLPFSDMLNTDTFMDHLKYCQDLLQLDTKLDIYASVINHWHAILRL